MADDKLKILYLMKMLLDETDKEHPMNAAEIAAKMKERYNYATYNRKTIYADIERLRTYGLKITQTRGAAFGYYVEKRDFDLAELKLMVDAVQASKFITKKKSEELIRKLETLTSEHNARYLNREVYIRNRVKSSNDSIYDALIARLPSAPLLHYKHLFGEGYSSSALGLYAATHIVSNGEAPALMRCDGINEPLPVSRLLVVNHSDGNCFSYTQISNLKSQLSNIKS